MFYKIEELFCIYANLLCAGENKYSDAKGTEISARVKVFTYKMQ